MQSMTDWLSRQPRYSRIMDQLHPNGKRFYVIWTNECEVAYQDLLTKFMDIGQIEVFTREDCDYYVVFCPVTSRVGTDIDEAEKRIPEDKPSILVVMHHTHNPDNVVVGSRRHITKPNIQLTVDFLFYKKRFLDCNRNDIAWHKIQRFLGVPEITPRKKWLFNWRCILSASCFIIVAAAIVTMVYFSVKKF